MLVSFIVPVYNAEPFLEECLNSLCLIKRYDVEFILVDDGSNDNSATICDTWKTIDSRIVVIHKKNGGVSSARNAGIKIAKGKWICFVDADDLISENFEKKILSILEESTDLLCFSNIQTDGKIKISSEIKDDYYVLEDNIGVKLRQHLLNKDYRIFQHDICKNITYTTPWGKIYKKELLSTYHILFDETVCWGEDIVFNFDYLKYAKKIMFLECIGYYYRINDLSISQRYCSEAMNYYEALMVALEKRIFNENDLANIRETFYLCVIRQFLFTAQRSIFNRENMSSLYEKRKELMAIRNSKRMVEAFSNAKLKEFRLTVRIPAFLLKKRAIILLCCLYKIKYWIDKIKK